MPYLYIENFEAGLDTRKSRFTAPPGSLRQCVNAHITRGKEIEKRKAFADRGTFASGSGFSGLYGTGDQLYTVSTSPASTATKGVRNYQVDFGGTYEVKREGLWAVQTFAGKVYVVVENEVGVVRHFYDELEVTKMTEIAGNRGDVETVAQALADRMEGAPGFQIYREGDRLRVQSERAFDPESGDTVACAAALKDSGNLSVFEDIFNEPPGPATPASGGFTVTGGTENPGVNAVSSVLVDGFEVIGSPIDFTVDESVTAQAVVDAINAVGLYSASRAGADVVITADAGLGASANGRSVEVAGAGDVTVGSVSDLSGGQDATEGVAPSWVVVIDAYDPLEVYGVRLESSLGGGSFSRSYYIEGASSAMPLAIRVLQQKMYAVAGPLVYFSGFRGGYDGGGDQTAALPDPTAWENFDNGTSAYVIGAGVLNLSETSPYADRGVGLGVYQNRLAVFLENSIQVWEVNADPDLTRFQQTLLSIGAVSSRAIIEYGDADIFFLSQTGVRSLRARDSSNVASTSDVGEPVDSEMTAYLQEVGGWTARRATAVVEPRSGRYLLAIGDRIYVFSGFPGSRVSAWGRYTTESPVAYWAVSQGRLYCRDVNEGEVTYVYLYGGEDGETYDDSEVVVETPFLDAGSPAGRKLLRGVDIGAEGRWKVELATEPNNPDAWETVCEITEGTYGSFPRIAANAASTHFALRFTHQGEGPALLGNIILHYDDVKAD